MDLLLSDFDILSESSSSEDQDDIESLYGRHAHSVFSSLEESIRKIDDFLLFERGFMHGEIVGLVSDPLGQTGKVVNVDMVVNLESLDGSKIQNVDSRNLQKIRSISVGDYVVCGAWLGKVENVVDCVTILFDDGTKSQLTTIDAENIVAISPDLVEDPQYPFYPGQRVQVELSPVSESTSWLSNIRKNKREHGTVCNVDSGLVYVEWIDCAVCNCKNEPAPQSLQDSKNLSLLPCFSYVNWQLGDWCALSMEQILPSAADSGLVEESDNSETVIQKTAVITKTKTKVDVQWQDGSQSILLDSHLLFPVNIIDVHDFWPHVFVLENGMVDSQVLGLRRWGVVKCVDSKERTVVVKWCKPSLDLQNSKEKETEEIVSAYELVEHPDYSYRLGDAVFRATKCVVNLGCGSYVKNHTLLKTCVGEEVDLKCIENSDRGSNVDSYFLSNIIGIVVGLEHGHIKVQWASGSVNEVAPYEIRRVGSSTFDTENLNQSNEELPGEESQLLGQNVKDVSGCNEEAKHSTSLSLSQAAIGFPEDEVSELCHSNFDGKLSILDDLDTPEKDILIPSSNMDPESFSQFDMVSDCSDHHFFNISDIGMQFPQMERSWLKKVHQEWSILKNDLPETIYVRAYEDRMNLLRALIIGTSGTPYHDGLFFFDFYLPPQYPNEPPILYYHSGGLRTNPNLYETGKVCLSLLNTWGGSDSEVWNPASSTVLQVLVSLQALVLNEKPYFNEAGYDTQIGKAEGEKNSVGYNENTFLLNCRSMLYILHKPPKHFEELVDEHFRKRSRHILSACRAYMQGATVGYPFGGGDNKNAEQETQKGSSLGFKIMLGKLLPRLVEAFSEKGFNCIDL
ncbi:probable ubiquitin-conjugating enzyme E2 24 isoform X2 [Henckelia pumila]|uniref:probable ubiquitin-conjugating enzyme E2 24 isoform X2 n=1 Tax=Henckelia pumila TaxID=405737 RepID=UPI003C6E1D64